MTKSSWSADNVQEHKVDSSSKSLPIVHKLEKEEKLEKSKKEYSIAFFINSQVFRSDVLDNGFSEPELIENAEEIDLVKMENYFTTSLMPKEVFESLPISENMMFYSGLQSNLDPDFWIYTERVDQGLDFQVRTFNVSTKESHVLFNNANSPNNKYAFKPIIISNDNSRVYLEALEFGSHLNNIEIWELNLDLNSYRKLKIHPNYNTTPKMSPDGKFLLYSSGSVPNDVHSPSNYINVFDLDKNKEVQVYANEKAYVGVNGWFKSG